jgi:predicted thioesterase
MINVIEAAALAAVEHLLPAGHQASASGSTCSLRGDAGGLTVTAAAVVTASRGAHTFRVEARDEREVIGEGARARGRNVARFDDRVQRKIRGGPA